MSTRQAAPDDVLKFWFDAPATTPEALTSKMKRWYQGGPEMDAEIIARFTTTVDDALAGKLGAWSAHPQGWLAEIIVLDQFTRNVLRDSPSMYEGDERAQRLALEALDSGRTHALPIEERNFALMPFVHAENLALQERGVVEVALLVEAAPAPLRPIFGMGVEQTRKYRDIIARFGRFPHRNGILGRTPTADEVEFLRDWEDKRKPSQLDALAGKGG